MNVRDTGRALLPPLLWAGLIWLIGGIESPPVPTTFTGLDKFAHFGMYGVLGWLCGRAVFLLTNSRVTAFVLIGLALLLGAGDELRQAQLAHRSSELADWVADVAGILAGFAVAALHARQRQRT